MRNKILLLFIAIGMCCCISPKYLAVKRSELAKLDLTNSAINYIPLADCDLKESKILDSVCHLIETKKYSKLDRYLNLLESSGVHTPDFYLSKTLQFITHTDYSKAAVSLKLIGNDDYSQLKRLLSIDLKYETVKINGGSGYSEFLKNYQDLIDSTPNDSILKKIAGLRLRYIRYNY